MIAKDIDWEFDHENENPRVKAVWYRARHDYNLKRCEWYTKVARKIKGRKRVHFFICHKQYFSERTFNKDLQKYERNKMEMQLL